MHEDGKRDVAAENFQLEEFIVWNTVQRAVRRAHAGWTEMVVTANAKVRMSERSTWATRLHEVTLYDVVSPRDEEVREKENHWDARAECEASQHPH